jgi:RNA-binding protein 39
LNHIFYILREKRKPNWAEEMREDILEECSKYGGIVHVSVDQNSPNGNVNLKYSNVTAAIEAMRSLNGRYFAGWFILIYL